MLSKRNISICGIVGFLFLLFVCLASVNVVNAGEQILTHIEEILKANPLKADEKIQFITIAQDDTISLLVVRLTEGFGVKRHIHKTHDETLYVIKGTAQLYINDKWVDIKLGSLHFNPMGNVHTIKNTGNEPLVVISIFTPALKEPDRHFVE
jgi:mannose-6-phosphate isomerase-like protein (cupin superfamily)